MEVQNLTVPVPADRVTEFYRWFADWRDGVIGTPPGPGRGEPALGDSVAAVTSGETEITLEAAVRWWRSLRPNERGIWGLWVEAAPKPLSADEIVEALGLKGPRDIPGSLSWSARKGKKAGFTVNWWFDYDPASGAPLYGLREVGGLTAIEYADLIRRARVEAEG